MNENEEKYVIKYKNKMWLYNYDDAHANFMVNKADPDHPILTFTKEEAKELLKKGQFASCRLVKYSRFAAIPKYVLKYDTGNVWISGTRFITKIGNKYNYNAIYVSREINKALKFCSYDEAVKYINSKYFIDKNRITILNIEQQDDKVTIVNIGEKK